MESLTSCPPWLHDDASALMSRSQNGRLPHALLLAGVSGIGKRPFARWLSESLLCRKPNLQAGQIGACGECESCRQLLADSHPDFKMLQPEGASAIIKVDAVRSLVDWLQLTAGQGSYRIALLEEADRLNRNAANSLLKTLEEPADNTILILTATRLGALPATIRSRCQKITIRMNDRQAALEWLEPQLPEPEISLSEASGAPYLAILNNSEEKLLSKELLLKAWSDLFLHKGSIGRISDSLSKLDTSECLASFSRWCLMASKHGEQLDVTTHPELQAVIEKTAERLEPHQWFTLYDRLFQLHRIDSASFKTQTVLEGLFADIRLMVRT